MAKLVLNLILVPNPAVGVNGAAWASVACHVIAFSIASTFLRKNIKLNLSFSKIFVKPVIATAIMGVCSYFIYSILTGIIVQKLATIISIVIAVIIYVLAVVALKIFTKDEILEIPGGEKIYKILKKAKIY